MEQHILPRYHHCPRTIARTMHCPMLLNSPRLPAHHCPHTNCPRTIARTPYAILDIRITIRINK